LRGLKSINRNKIARFGLLRINPEKGRGVEEASSATIETKLSKRESFDVRTY